MMNSQGDFGFRPSPAATGIVAADRVEIRDILSGNDGRLLVIVGPCSAWPEDAVLTYAEKLRAVSDAVSDRIKIVMRVYTQKPRTVDGWNGLLVQPDPFSSPDMEEGLRRAAALMERIVLMGLPIADEALFLSPSLVLSQWLSWTAIGARSSEDQEHRAYASGIGIPVGVKHPTSGSVPVGVNGIVAARSPQFSPLFSDDSFTDGNPHAHLVLRGGESGTNYDAANILAACRLLREKGIGNPAVLVDSSHDNVRIDGVKDPSRQIAVTREVLASLSSDREAQEGFRGFMLESFLKPGNQDLRKTGPDGIDRDGLSITDPCLSWMETESLLREMAVTWEGKKSAMSAISARESH
ncbi:MAG TPA: 3-deoxy-7-phosphoheptulonate synthase [Candidatus Fimivivens sp.]|nr:3-deoxy-7-phosphoheptulonate synthase [Candidatus Fimivivens sp.]